MAKTPQRFDEINITPLTDIFLVLLIIMMVVAPMMSGATEEIKVPSIKAGSSVEAGKATVEVGKSGTLYVSGVACSKEQLVEKLRAVLPAEGDKVLVIKADQAARSRHVLGILQAAREARFEKVVVQGNPVEKSTEGAAL